MGKQSKLTKKDSKAEAAGNDLVEKPLVTGDPLAVTSTQNIPQLAIKQTKSKKSKKNSKTKENIASAATSILGAVGKLDPKIASLFSTSAPVNPVSMMFAPQNSCIQPVIKSIEPVVTAATSIETKSEINTENSSKSTEIDVADGSDAEDATKAKEQSLSRREKLKELIARQSRTIFVGNLPICVTEKAALQQLKTLFSQFGTIECIRFRSIAFNSKLPRKLAYSAKQFHDKRDSLNAYIVYELPESVSKALELHGTLFLEKHLRVDRSETTQQKKYDHKKSIFIGNLLFDISEEALWSFFSDCGDITNVRVIRDRNTNVGKGFGYVQFAERSSVSLALKLNDTDLQGRQVRISRSNPTLAESGNSTTKSTAEGLRASKSDNIKRVMGRVSKKIKTKSVRSKAPVNKSKSKPKASAAK
ncbi:hypothetical protein BATDEDRAFT_36238 [Batrachochytrium dendrobatidis JAM81]|uniref:Nucleolar protein 12 n=2 Tax=Batrachochytrium dendrobatidis TaxID=109871 RepID=F4PDV3_BATDJ|nr:uncharacterized protein BATDEDRAFT_36238 [Batrachochytrium dendrobatidis JAM81]EGF76564.1 hypothetical protein BATDEDRAFT_36238 [Batrachochytrium dendrobatidis JAM81]OAJ39153.1 hypothetical protein BDEG_23021 [Batrachochytrium dendrobatidis JEL423]|eukprot:XP_006682857.1 hypothetical protein BATDEDRAFT_36238 [Batrachochytrium dendrobatidis JAM81]